MPPREAQEQKREAQEQKREAQQRSRERQKRRQRQQRLEEELAKLKATLGDSNDVKIHQIRFGPENSLSGALISIDGLADGKIITEAILWPLNSWHFTQGGLPEGDGLLELIMREVLCTDQVDKAVSSSELIAGCLSGDTVLLVAGCPGGLVINSKGWEKRGVSEPQSETVVRGPREGFTENLRANTAMIRRKIKSEQLRVSFLKVGRKTQTSVCLMYVEGVADPRVVEEVQRRVSQLDVDSILESGYIEEYIEDAPLSPFPTVGYSEKPDVVAGRMLEGRVAVVVDGTPFVLTAPMLFIESFQSAEDYYSRSMYATFTRILRYTAFVITLFGPAIHIALVAFHRELLPTTLLFSIANARQGTPFPVFVEALIMVFAFEILREAGIRLPRPVGQAISIVGALIMGDAAVSAGLVGAPMVVTVALTAVAGFAIPSQNDSGAILRIIMMVLAAVMGLYGVVLGFLAMLIHLASLESFGVPYFDSIGWSRDMQDAVVRVPLWSMLRRPEEIARGDIRRIRFFIPPLRPHRAKEAGRADNAYQQGGGS